MSFFYIFLNFLVLIRVLVDQNHLWDVSKCNILDILPQLGPVHTACLRAHWAANGGTDEGGQKVHTQRTRRSPGGHSLMAWTWTL